MSSPTRRSARRTDDAALRILASSIVRELRKSGYGPREMVGLASELIELACESIRSGGRAARV